MKKLAAVVACMGALASSCTDDELGESEQELITSTGDIMWQGTIPMCWQWARGFPNADAVNAAKVFIYRTILEHWVLPTRLAITFDECPTTDSIFGGPYHVRITMGISPSFNGNTVDFGVNTLTTPAQRADDPNSLKPGLLLGFPLNWNSSNDNRTKMRGLVLHEFGHVLGFHHEQEHPDGNGSIDPCYDTADPYGGIALGAPDKDSVMGWSYCNGRNLLKNTVLTPNDLFYTRQLYGASATHLASPAAHASDVFCRDGEECRLGDVDGDGMKDVIAFGHGVTGTDVWVGYASNGWFGYSFGPPQQKSSYFCVAGESCEVADVNGDGRDDLVAFTRGSAHSAWVALSTGDGFLPPQQWSSFVCLDGEVCKLADVTGDGRADVVVFTHGATPQAWVLRSVPFTLFTPEGFSDGEPWSGFFCASTETCDVGDMTGDGLADLVAFTRGSAAQVWVGVTRADGGTETPTLVGGRFCLDGEECRIADVDGDGRGDALAFGHGVTGNGVWVGHTSRARLELEPPVAWSSFLCLAGETCLVGDVTGDGAADVVAATRGMTNDLWLARAEY